jgi:ABC-type transporter Mla subunit MlaD
MRPDPAVEFTLGLCAILAALGIALLLAFPPAWLDNRKTAVAIFPSIGTLTTGANLRDNGTVVGNVVAIEPMGGFYRIRMKVQPDWKLAEKRGLTVEETNPLQAASLGVASICRLPDNGAIPAGCCPGKLETGRAAAGEIALASCGRTPSLIDAAMATTLKASAQITALSNAFQEKAPPLLASTQKAVDATLNGMIAMKAVSDYARGVLSQNEANLKGTLANANTTLGNVSSTTKTFDELLTAKREQLDTSITSVTAVLATTAATMPGIVADLQKAAEDLRAVTGQIRNEPTSIIRRRERADPSFVEPAAEK